MLMAPDWEKSCKKLLELVLKRPKTDEAIVKNDEPDLFHPA
jgi:hypothetical protein